ncbi:MAG: D-2-hydroxyacid dehydrogenase [Kiritimatiellae bacterium]|nr:D-2-hydroxyacid dehydrogenase [Kiritimatiellia bacterium]
MKIVVLDGYRLNPGDLSWDGLHALGECTVHDRTPADQTVARAAGAEIVLTNKTVLSKEILDRLPALKYIGVLATGYNVVDVEAARARGIPVTNAPEYATQAVAQMVFAHLLNLAHRIGDHARGVAEGKWTNCPDFCYWDFPLVEFEGLTLGIVGIGRIGRAVAALGRAFGMRVIACDAFPPDPVPDGITMTDLDALFRQSDAISLHCPLTDETRGLVNAERLALMKETAFLVNTSRGPLVDGRALADALNNGRIAGAGLDVLEVEPPPADSPLFTARNGYVTPHIAWATRAARQRLLNTVVANVRAFLAGEPVNVVN